MLRGMISWALGVCVLLGVGAAAVGQVTTGTISGTVSDATGAVAPGATITVKNTDTGISRTVTTDAAGRYSALQLGLGNYEVTAEAAGFQTVVRSGITLTVGREAVVNFTMQVGAVAERITVTGEAPLVDTTSAQVAGLTSSSQVHELPLNGRSFDQLTALQPGVTVFRQVLGVASTSFSTRFSVSGARPDTNSLLMDGIEINAWGRTGGGSAVGLFLGVDAVQEFKVLTHNYSAEFGQHQGGIINIVTRSGTNSLHGSAFEFLRNDRLDARNFFDKEKSMLRRNQFGGSVGGPVVRDKLFFTAYYEGFRERRGSPITNFVLSESARTGDLGDGTKINVAPEVVPFLRTNVMPLPNAGLLPGGVTGRFLFQFLQPATEDNGMGRLDYQANDKDSLFGRFTISRSHTQQPDLFGGTPFFRAFHQFENKHGMVAHTRILSPSSVNVLRVGFKRSAPTSDPSQSPEFPKDLTFIPGRPFGKLNFTTSANTAGTGAAAALTPIGQPGITPGRWFQTGIQINDQFAYSRGPHAFKLGVEYELIRDQNQNGKTEGAFSFTSIENFLQARPASFSAPLPSWDISFDTYQNYFAWYVIDDFRVAPRVTLNLGWRHEFITAPRDRRRGHTAAFVDPIHDPDVTLTNVFFNTTLNNFAPRVGAAWDVFGDGKTSVRAGFGMHYDLWIGRNFGNFIQPAPQFRGTLTVQPPTRVPVFPNEYEILQAQGFPPSQSRAGGRYTRFYDLNTPTLLQYSFEIQQEVFPTGIAKVGYVGSRGYNMQSETQTNARLPKILPDGRFFFDRGDPLRNPNLNPITENGSDGSSWYNSLQTEFRMRPTHGLELQVNYVWSKFIDTSSALEGADARGAPTIFMNPFDRNADKSLSNMDVRHNLSLNYLYDFPATSFGGVMDYVVNGWSLGGILTLSSGNPFTPLVGFCQSDVEVNCGADRPDIAPGRRVSEAVRGGRNPNQFFDPTVFVLPQRGTFGNAGRNILIGPGFKNFDFSVFKKFPIAEGKILQFRAEFFNLGNRPNFALPGGNLFTSSGGRQANAGVITKTNSTSREIQFGLKLRF